MGIVTADRVGRRQVRFDPVVLARESMPDSCIAEINRKITNRSLTPMPRPGRVARP